MLADPIKAAAYREANRKRSKAHRDNATEDQKKIMVMQSKVRMQKCRLNKTTNAAAGTTSKPRTRIDQAAKNGHGNRSKAKVEG